MIKNKSIINLSNDYEMMYLKDCVTFKTGDFISKKTAINGDVAVVGGGKSIPYYHNESNRNGETLAMSSSGVAGFVSYWNVPVFVSGAAFTIEPDKRILTKYLYYYFKFREKEIFKMRKGKIAHISPKALHFFKIFVPPIEKQKETIKLLEKIDEIKLLLDKRQKHFKKEQQYYKNFMM